jgi:nucleotide-binding universal stress UspA family protein
MRILLAIDGSGPSRDAVTLVAMGRWPAGTQVRIVIVDEAEKQIELAPWLGEPVAPDRGPSWSRRQAIARLADGASELIREMGLPVEAATRHGWAADGILREAAAWHADLIVLGSRGHGLLATALLGSVSAAVVDRAQCPVLVARRGSIGKVLVGVDAFGASDAAIDFVVRHKLFLETPIELVGVVYVQQALTPVPPVGFDVPLFEHQLEQARAEETAEVFGARKTLEADGRSVHTRIISGPPESALLLAARTADVDLIVVGTRGEHGLRRLLHGSVAQGVLMHAPCSVLIVPPRREPPARAGRNGRDSVHA